MLSAQFSSQLVAAHATSFEQHREKQLHCHGVSLSLCTEMRVDYHVSSDVQILHTERKLSGSHFFLDLVRVTASLRMRQLLLVGLRSASDCGLQHEYDTVLLLLL